jgi:MFS family permease
MTPQVISFIQVSFAPQERQTATSAYVVTLGLASILGLVLGGGLIVANILGMGWRSIFLINIPIGLLVLLATLLWVSESKAPGSQNLDYGGVTLLTLSLMLFTFALIMGGNTGWPLWSIICLVLSLPCIVAFWTYERWLAKRGKIALISPSLFRLRQFTAGNLTNLLDGTLWNGMLFLVSIYLQTTLHLSPLQSGLSMTVGSIAFIIASSANATLTRCLGRLRKRNLSIGAGMMAVSYLLFLLATKFLVAHGGVIPVLVAFFILCFSHGFFYTLVMPKTLEEVTTDHVGAASGIFTTTAAISSTFGVAIIGMIYAALTISYKNSLAAFELTMLLITLVSLGVIIFVQPLEASRSNISQ